MAHSYDLDLERFKVNKVKSHDANR